MPNNAENLVIKAYAVVAIAFAARGVEALMLTWERVTRLTDNSTGETNYRLLYERVKPQDEPDTEAYALIAGEIEVQILDAYSACFNEKMKTEAEGRFFRKLSMARNALHATKMKLGKNLAFNYGKRVASILGLVQPDKYTGHCCEGHQLH